ncbi:MAG: hypothetical protein RR100_16615 [Comamonas sp.]
MPSPIQLQRLPRRKKPAPMRALLFLVLLLLLCVWLSGCSAQAADAPITTTAADLKRAAAGAWLCPGMHAEWIDSQTVQCLKEKP